GADGLGFAAWKEAFDHAHYLWYLFRADLIAENDPETTQLVRSHLSMFKIWSEAKAGDKPRVILIGTHADQHPDFHKHPARVVKTVSESGTIQFGSVKLGNAGVVIGSLATPKDAEKVVKGIKGRLLGDARRESRR